MTLESVVLPFTKSGAGNWQTDWVWCRNAQLFIMQVTWPAVGGLAGVLSLDITQDPARAATSVISLVPTSGFYGDWPNVAAGVAGTASVFIKSPAASMRGKFVGGGGGANNFTGWLEVRF